ncbi:MAG TPA: helicase-related protein, partial [Urbifossiella sp.]|nr:helicase-related protein [Urbifossiella sp.]
HSQMMVAEFIAAGVAAAHIDATTPSHVRRQHILNFATGHLRVLWNCDLFSEGFDLSAVAGRDVPIECAIQARPTKSLTLHLQQVGRALRRKPEPAILLDLCGNLARLGLPDHPHEWALAGRPKKGRGGGGEAAPLTRKCQSCDVLFPTNLPDCPHCGAAQPAAGGGGRKIDEVAGQLQEIDREQVRRQRLAEQASAQTLEQLIELGRAKGYKSPERWASHVFTARLQKSNQAG